MCLREQVSRTGVSLRTGGQDRCVSEDRWAGEEAGKKEQRPERDSVWTSLGG